MASDRESIEVIYHGTSASGKAYKVEKTGSANSSPVWVPVSQCDLVPKEPAEGATCWLMIPMWLAIKSELA